MWGNEVQSYTSKKGKQYIQEKQSKNGGITSMICLKVFSY